jgi:hypothetical protein
MKSRHPNVVSPMKMYVTMMNAIGVFRSVTAARNPSAMAQPTIHVQASITHRSSGDLYTPNTSAATNQPTRNGQSTVRYHAIPEEMS